MPKIVFVDCDGAERVIEANVGESVMEAAIRTSTPGIDADCGGACACATCHVYVAPPYIDSVGRASDGEREMLDFAEDPQSNSRLACQIKVSETLCGLRVSTPKFQH